MKRQTILVLLAGLTLLTSAGFAANLSVTNSAAIADGNFGLRVAMDGTTQNAFVRDDTPACETTYRVQHNVRNQLTMNIGDAHNMLRVRMPGHPFLFLVQAVRDFAGNNVMYIVVGNDAGGVAGVLADFLPGQHTLRYEWVAASAPGANDGVFRYFRGANPTPVGEITGIDSDTLCAEFVEMGAFGGVDAASTGEMHFDAFSSFRTLSP